ncbi:YhcH/YjgK/YiaL family protein [Bifidobacterium sp.]|uniref:YhcH/YjgK/YiaL family protein n=1 Tax=Bifidobacterium sp. TaxID=41200 RepID=UPI0025C0B697|nr:YhcH/YjgK/YiaL family protein [Bifidobacterium sp.]MCI1634978.1 YhcH/YjgK/YiaL family protein [Bifidobacterium sp.]
MLWTNVHHVDVDDYARLQQAIELLKHTDWSVPASRHIDLDEHCFAQLLEYKTQAIENIAFEVHHHRLDIHYIVEGEETIQVSMDHPKETEYLEERDLAHVEPPESCSSIVMRAGDALIIGMDEPHRTNGLVRGTASNVRKVVLKMKH